MGNLKIKFSLLGAAFCMLVFGVAYFTHVGPLTIVSYVLAILLMFFAGALASRRIFKTGKSKDTTTEENSKVKKQLIWGFGLFVFFWLLLFFYSSMGFRDELSNLYPLLSKSIYAALCIFRGICGAIVSKAVAVDYCGSVQYGEIDRITRFAYLLLWFCIFSAI
ncbi:MAG: hypothetical protein ACOYJG_01970 [Prevotella sp.]|jgi:hypothetical protein